MGERRRTLWARHRLHVDVVLTAQGDLVFEGQDLDPPMRDIDEYEYWVTVPAAEVPRVVLALGGRARDDVLALLETHAEHIVRTGERTWLTEHGIEHGFFSY